MVFAPLNVSDQLWAWKTALYRLFRHHVPPFSTIYRAEKRALQRWLSAVDGRGLWLDLGCGEGTSFSLAEWKGNRVGVDRVRRLLARVSDAAGAFPVCADAEHLPLKDGCADLVTAIGLAEYLPRREPLWRQIWNVLRPGGLAVVTAARPGLFNRARWLLGHRISTAGRAELLREFRQAGLEVRAEQVTLLQWQFFLLKPKGS